ncbi:hypothetical protein CEXT_563381 [Caerostris extrusa]|uniref:Uncharacterized protein n=1 Tax=Caerostris extrusa TaxID=172846 RepID=A0AAV4XGM7_CAEEX|nr:hypothetical protein CEXT_563381 [Caerostris extrusa]
MNDFVPPQFSSITSKINSINPILQNLYFSTPEITPYDWKPKTLSWSLLSVCNSNRSRLIIVCHNLELHQWLGWTQSISIGMPKVLPFDLQMMGEGCDVSLSADDTDTYLKMLV